MKVGLHRSDIVVTDDRRQIFQVHTVQEVLRDEVVAEDVRASNIPVDASQTSELVEPGAEHFIRQRTTKPSDPQGGVFRHVSPGR